MNDKTETTNLPRNAAVYSDHAVIHADRIRNSRTAIECPQAIDLGKGYCWNCHNPVERVEFTR